MLLIQILTLSLFSFADIQVTLPEKHPAPIQLKSSANLNEAQQKHIQESDHSSRISRCLQQIIDNFNRYLNSIPNPLREIQPLKPNTELTSYLTQLRSQGYNPRGVLTLDRTALRLEIHLDKKNDHRQVSLHNFAIDLGGNLSYSICSASQSFHQLLRTDNYGPRLISKMKESRFPERSNPPETTISEELAPTNY